MRHLNALPANEWPMYCTDIKRHAWICKENIWQSVEKSKELITWGLFFIGEHQVNLHFTMLRSTEGSIPDSPTYNLVHLLNHAIPDPKHRISTVFPSLSKAVGKPI